MNPRYKILSDLTLDELMEGYRDILRQLEVFATLRDDVIGPGRAIDIRQAKTEKEKRFMVRVSEQMDELHRKQTILDSELKRRLIKWGLR